MNLSERVQSRAYERRWLILAVLCFSLLIIVLDNSILNVAIPTIVRDLDASNSQIQWIIDSYTLVFAGLLLTMGSLGDRYGRRGALQVGFVLFGLGSLASALAGSADQLIGTRAFMGIGGALIMPATLSIITNVFPSNERGRAIGFWAGTAGAGAALGPLTGGFLLEHFYWGSVFLVNLPIVALGLLAGFFLIPDSKDPATPKLDPVGALASIVGLSALLYAIIEAPDSGWTDPAVLVALVGGLALAGVFIWWETRTDHPMLDVRFFANPRFSAASASITFIFFAMFGSLFLLTQYLQFTLGYDPLAAGIRLLPFALTMGVVAAISPKVVERVGTKVVVATGLLLVTAGLLLMTQLGVDESYGNLIWRLMVMAVGMGLTMAPATESVMGSLPLAKAGVGSAVNDTTRQVGGALGVAIIGSVMSSTYGSRVGEWFDRFAPRVPPQGQSGFESAKEAAQGQLGAAIQIAQDLPDQLGLSGPAARQLSADLVRTANEAFVGAMHYGVAVAAIATFVGAIVAALWLPAHARATDVAEQAEEYAREMHVAGDGGERPESAE
ncbi:MAG TPA: MFS transporter [Acidimicrobiia bacterium]|nr:MFS transporter [Acidimicrobiia bacterium]